MTRSFATLTVLVNAEAGKEIKNSTTLPEPLLAALRSLGCPYPLA
jgi:hypothetical protein